jgi:hypothetical protein
MKVGKVEIVKKSWTVPVSNIEDLKVCPNCERYRKALKRCLSACGVPDPQDALRVIIHLAKEAINED